MHTQNSSGRFVQTSTAWRWAAGVLLILATVAALTLSGCSNMRAKNQAKEAAARYWQSKAYPGKGFDIQVVDAEPAEGGTYRVKGIVDGETRVGIFSPESETFSEGYYSLAHERNRRVAELEQEVKYWKEKAESFEKENYKLKVQMGKSETKAEGQSGSVANPTP